jgi:hypothetical protein
MTKSMFLVTARAVAATFLRQYRQWQLRPNSPVQNLASRGVTRTGVSEIEVTPADIANAKPKSLHCCPIALAANRAFGMDEGCMFAEGYGDWKLTRGEEQYRVVGGDLFAREFDSGSQVKPRKFKLVRLRDVVGGDPW